MPDPIKPTDERAGRPAAPPLAGADVQAAQTIHCDDSACPSLYFNFVQVTGTPEEVILDFGLNPQPMGVPDKPIKLSQKLVSNYYTAKRLLVALQMTIQRHEGAFGVLEIDVNKRFRPAAMR